MALSENQEKLLILIKKGGKIEEIRNVLLELTQNGQNLEHLKFHSETDTDGESPLHLAVKNNKIDILKLLLKKGPVDYVCYKNKLGWNVLVEAGLHRNAKLIDCIIKNVPSQECLDDAILEKVGEKRLKHYLNWKDSKYDMNAIDILEKIYEERFENILPLAMTKQKERISLRGSMYN